ncbi:TlpA family protein disulfide reductase [Herbiconiux sp. A18JL235]|uniref:TlpA family protein disulfide reductase n=1 Tax=Herbiconiux sp. A18JL235 TaxID=3152363 RepID=A0AB39BLJ1_9MICO
MSWTAPLAFIVALVALSTVLGVLWRARQGRATPTPRRVTGTGANRQALEPALFAAGGFGDRATLVQFSTDHCASCPSTRRVLREISAATTDVAYLDVDVTNRADLVRRFAILQTPTTLVLDRHGVVRTRIGGAARRAVVEKTLQELR